MKKSKLSMLLSSLFLFAIMSVSAQKTITGSVSDSNGPLPGATVTVEGTNTGTTSDFDGNFSISVDDGAILLVSYVGYQTQSITVGNQSSIDVVLTSDGSLDEVIVVGYGSQREKEITS
ncbi:MAG: SusC/RagA family TonB-linked outer membrane protein, partial [Flavobacteriaceae bacterium]|nr:SusC/RagA family TonB-linked outer membrane protein [Flavobacteriaceae bacterium]